MIWPFSTLTDPDAPKGSYLLAALVAAIVPAWIIGFILQAVLDPALLQEVNDAVLSDDMPFAVTALLIVVFAPVVETAIMVLIFGVTRFLRFPPWLQVITQVVIWAAAHGSQANAWTFAPAWLFLVFSIVWLTQRKNSAGAAFWMTTFVHAANNAVPVTLLALQTYGLIPEPSL